MNQRAFIAGTGMHVPERVVTNDELIRHMETSDEWIRQRTGIERRHWVAEGGGVGSSDLALVAAGKALADAGWEPGDVELILFATLSPDIEFPGAGCLLQHKLGLATTPAMDIRNQCSGFLYGLATANAFVASGQYRRILLIGAEVHSTGLDVSTRGRNVSVIFGDGAGAACVAAGDGDRGVLASVLHAQGEFSGCLTAEAPTSRLGPRISHEMLDAGRQYPHMDGPTVFKHAVRRLPEVAKEVLDKAGLSLADVDLVIPHQANLRINQFVAQTLKLSEDKVVNNIQNYGNTTAASIPIALDEARRAGRVPPGTLVLFLSFGAGFTWAGALHRF